MRTPVENSHAVEAITEPLPAALQRFLELELPAWLPRQRWFGAKGAALGAIRIGKGCPLPPTDAWLVLVEVGAAAYSLVASAGDLNAAEHAEVRLALLTRLGGDATASRLGGAEQSNTSIIYDQQLILKLFRRLEAGINPDAEILAALARYGFDHVPAAHGELRLDEFSVAVLQQFVPNQGDGWEWLLGQLAAGDEALAALGLLGQRTAELHFALAQALGAEAMIADDVAALHARYAAAAGALASTIKSPLGARLAAAPSLDLDALAQCDKIRVHGDYHLGQVLATAEDWVIFDFEGEPARPLEQRRQRECVLKDVAGMLRSFNYAAVTQARRQPDREAEMEAWEQRARAVLLERYFGVLDTATTTFAFAPPPGPAREAALVFFEREKAIYEYRYELHHRPDWVEVPRRGLERLLNLG